MPQNFKDKKPVQGQVNRSSPGPLYRQVRNWLKEKIISGQWPAESRIPSENELVELLGVSRMTINRAVRELAAEGWLDRQAGVGTFVAAPRAASALLELKPISEEIAARGGVHSCRVETLESIPAEAETAAALSLSIGDKVFYSLMVHFEGSTAIQLEERFVNPAVAPDYLNQDFTTTTAGQYLLAVAPLSEVDHLIEAVMPDEATRRLLAMAEGEPCLAVRRRTWSNDVPATKSLFLHPATRFSLGGSFKPAWPTQQVEA